MTYEEIRKSFREVLSTEESNGFNEVKFRILFKLYQKHYSNELRHPQITTKLIEESGMTFFESDVVYSDIVYLKDKGFVKGQYSIGTIYPYSLIIIEKGIDETKKVDQQICRVFKRTIKYRL